MAHGEAFGWLLGGHEAKPVSPGGVPRLFGFTGFLLCAHHVAALELHSDLRSEVQVASLAGRVHGARQHPLGPRFGVRDRHGHVPLVAGVRVAATWCCNSRHFFCFSAVLHCGRPQVSYHSPTRHERADLFIFSFVL